MNALVRFILSIAAVRWLRKTSDIWLIPLCVLCVIWVIHSEFLSFLSAAYPASETEKYELLVVSYLLKWSVTFVVIVWVLFRSKRRVCSKKIAPSFGKQSRKKTYSIAKNDQSSPEPKDDGFNFLREKKRLESGSDKILKGTVAGD